LGYSETAVQVYRITPLNISEDSALYMSKTSHLKEKQKEDLTEFKRR
jgi:hypothetical protein